MGLYDPPCKYPASEGAFDVSYHVIHGVAAPCLTACSTASPAEQAGRRQPDGLLGGGGGGGTSVEELLDGPRELAEAERLLEERVAWFE